MFDGGRILLDHPRPAQEFANNWQSTLGDYRRRPGTGIVMSPKMDDERRISHRATVKGVDGDDAGDSILAGIDGTWLPPHSKAEHK